jgi:uncharacterized protein
LPASTSEGYLDLLRRTLQAGADVHSKDSYNSTGLIRAAERGHIEIIQELLKTDIEVVRFLVEAGADVNLADSNGITPLTHARQRSQTRSACMAGSPVTFSHLFSIPEFL